MDLSVNKVKYNKKNLSFKGVKGDLSSNNVEVFRFTTPSHNHNEAPYLEIIPLKRERNSKGVVDSNNFIADESLRIPFENKNTIEVPQEIFEKTGCEAFAYRFAFAQNDDKNKATDNKNINFRYAVDASKRIKLNKAEYNLIEIGNNFGLTPQGGSMYHAFIDSVGYDPSKMNDKDKEFIRTHANKLGGTIKGITYLLKQGYYDSYKYIISNPDIGADPTSPHGYWPNNQYQCSNMQDFKDLNFELFKRGKGYVADGAFTSQSLQSPLLQHVLKWGQQSPFYHMLKVNDKIQLGVLPENEEALKHVGIKLINSPEAKNYDKNKPTLMQFVDDRLVNYTQKHDTKNPITQYAIPNPEDHYDIVDYQDTIHPFYFEIDSDDFDKKIGCFKNKNYIMLSDLNLKEQEDLFGFKGGDITSRYQAGNATFWAGNVDLVKMNLSNPNMADEEDVKGFEDARNYLINVATFWTEAIQSDLLKRTAALSENEIKGIAHNFGIMDEEYKAIKDSVKNGDSISHVLKREKNEDGTGGKYIRSTIDYVKEFPLQSIETSPELSAIFSEPEFQSELLKDKADLLAYYVDSVIIDAIPEKYKDNDEYKQYVTKTYANEILKYLYCKAMSPDSVNPDGTINLKELKNKVTLNSFLNYKPGSVEAERSQVIKKIKHNISDKDFKFDEIKHKIGNELKDISLEKFKLAESVILQTKAGLNWRFDASKDVGDLDSVNDKVNKFYDIWNGNGQVEGVQQFWKNFVSNIKKYNPGSYIIAEITDFGGFSPWMDFDSAMNFDKKLTNTFLEKFKDNILETDPNDPIAKCAVIFGDKSLPDSKRKEAFEKAKEIMSKTSYDAYKDKYPVLGEYENHVSWAKEQNFLEQIGATAGSNYVQYFNKISFFVGVDPENGKFKEVGQKQTGHLKTLKQKTESLLKYTQPNTGLLSHTFTDNHDKPRVPHALPLDMDLYLSGLNLNVIGDRPRADLSKLKDDDERKSKIIELAGRTDLQNVNPMAAAVGLMMSDKLKEAKEAGILSDEEKEKLKVSLRKFVNGENNNMFDSRRARAFGFLPYEFTVNDLFKDAKIDNEEKMEAFNRLIMEVPMYLEDKIWQVLTGLTGVPTLYYGTEYAQTGYETYAKNELVGNRNRALYERKNDGIYSKFYDKMNATSALSTNHKLSALRNGFPESLEIHTVDNLEMYPIYRKDERNSEVISVLTNFGIEPGKLSKDQKNKFSDQFSDKDKVPSKMVSEISIKDKNGRCPLDEGTKLKRMVYNPAAKQYITEDTQYVVKNGSIKRIGKKGSEDIEINDTLAVFYVDKKKTPKFVSVYNGAH